MSIARHHAEWLSLVEVSGPFLSMPVLLRVFPQGLEAHDPEHLRLLRMAHEEWEENQSGRRPDPAIHRAWVRFVLTQTLGFPEGIIAEGQAIPQTLRAAIAEHGETLRPDVMIRNPVSRHDVGKPEQEPAGGTPALQRLLIQVLPAGQDPDKPIPGRHWKASPATRMMELLHATSCRLGLVTNGEHWMLVDAPVSETTGFVSWYASLWLEEQLTLRAFRSLLSARRFFAAPENETLEAMLAESALNQQEVTEQLGYQVRRAVEVLVQALDNADQDHGRELLSGVPETALYEAALTVMMRLVFLFSAEERELLLLGTPLYDQHYAVSTLQAQLRETADQHGEEILERRFDAWSRLLATFRAVHAGVQHEDLRLPAYGGHLFDPDRFPFLEGRRRTTRWRDTPASPLPVDNRTVLHLLEALQFLNVRLASGGARERRRLSFRALDIEQIGHVYEGLLDHTAKRAAEPILGLAGSKDKEPEIPLAELERLKARGDDALVEWLHEHTGRSENALRKALLVSSCLGGEEASRLQVACRDEALWQRVRPFAGLIRNDTFGYPVVILPGSVYVTAGADRRTTGTHYTPRSLTEPIVQYTLEPLVYIGPAEGKPKEEWKLRTARELLDLKICDMATGSGAFLVQACRFLSERLVEAWEDAEKQHPGTPGITPEGTASTGAVGETIIPKDADERLAYAKRLIAQRCLYGVDRNSLAVEMAKLSLWLLTVAKDKPFTFLDHAIRLGDSLLGVDLEQLKTFSLDRTGGGSPVILHFMRDRVQKALELRLRIEQAPAATVADAEAQEELLRQAEEQIRRLKAAADFLLAPEFFQGPEKERKEYATQVAVKVGIDIDQADAAQFEREAGQALGSRPTFHWPLEFPEVFDGHGGFDAMVCNPPFMGGSKITNAFDDEYRDYLVSHIALGRKGKADLCAYFVLRAACLVGENSTFAFLLTNSISDGDNRVVCLEALIRQGVATYRADTDVVWPGSAGVTISKLWFYRGNWGHLCILDGVLTSGIDSFLEARGTATGSPARLVANLHIAFRGTEIKGTGFLLTPEEAAELLRSDGRNADVIYPYLTGEDLNQTSDQRPTRMAINFRTWDIERARKYKDCFAIVEARVRPYRETLTEQVHEWDFWKFWDKRLDCYERIKDLPRVLVRSQVGNVHSIVFQSPGIVFSHKVLVFGLTGMGDFAVLQSSIHEEWARKYSGAPLRTDMCYSTKLAFETFPFPRVGGALISIGQSYYEQRERSMVSRGEGLTALYNRFHGPEENAEDVRILRRLHCELDEAVKDAYGWADFRLDQGFHRTKKGVRFTMSEAARREVLARLLKLNHERYAEEVAAGLHDKKAKGKPGRKGRGSAARTQAAANGLLFQALDE